MIERCSCLWRDAQVYNNAEISGNAQVFGDVRILKNAWISGNAWVYRNVHAWVSGNARVYGNAQISGNVCLGYIPINFDYDFDPYKSFKKILDHKEILPILSGIDPGLDKMISERLR